MSNLSKADAFFQEGQEQYDCNEFSGALESFKYVIRIKADCSIAYFYQGCILDTFQNYKKAISYYKKAIEIKPDYAEAYLNWGLTLYNLQDYQEAIKKYEEATKAKPNYAEAYLNWGLALYNLQDYQEAIKKYKIVLEINSKNADAYFNWGLALYNLQAYKEAVEKYEAANKYRESFLDNYNNWGAALSKLESYEEAIEKYKKATEIDLECIAAYVNWGIALEKIDCYEEAIKKYETATEKSQIVTGHNEKNLNKAFNRWGDILRLFNRYEEAIEIYKKSASSGLGDFYTYFNHGLALANLNRYEEAIEIYKQAIEINPKHPYPHHNIAIAFWQRGFYERGWGYWKKTYKVYEEFEEKNKNDENLNFFYYFGYVLHEIFGELDEAEKIYQKGLHLDNDNIDLLLGLFDLYQEKKDKGYTQKFKLESILPYNPDKRSKFEGRVDYYWKERETYRKILFLVKKHLNSLEVSQSKESNTGTSEYQSTYKELTTKVESVRKYIFLGELTLKMEAYSDSEDFLNRALNKHKELEEMKEEELDSSALEVSIDISPSELASLYSNLGVLASKNLDFKQAEKYLQAARRVHDFEDLNIWSNLAEVYLKSGNLEAAEQEYKAILKVSPYHLGSRIGLSETYIEIADNKDIDSYSSAIDYLTRIIQMSKSSGFLTLHQNPYCQRLKKKELAGVFYLRGYARAKLYEKSRITSNISELRGALRDFRQCLKHDSKNYKAEKVIEKIEKKIDRFAPQRIIEIVGPATLFTFSMLVFGLTQYSFWGSRFRSVSSDIQTSVISQKDTTASSSNSSSQDAQELSKKIQETAETLAAESELSIDGAQYTLLTFGSLTFMVVGLYLPQLITLKIPGIELEKSSIDQIKATGSLGITR